MDFNHFLSSYFPDLDYGGKQLYADMVEQAVAAERLGYRGVSLPVVPDAAQHVVMRCRAGTSGLCKEIPGLRSNIACCPWNFGAHGTTGAFDERGAE